MSDLLKCRGCLENYYSEEQIPRLLSCGHSLCTDCVQKFTEDQNSCPECNQKEPLKSIDEYAINNSLLRFVQNLVHIRGGSLALLSKVFNDSEHKDGWCCEVHKSPICLFCHRCISWICQDCLVIDHATFPRGKCSVIEFVDALKKIEYKYKKAVDETAKDIESMKENFVFDMSIHDFCLKHCTKERSHMRMIECVEDLTQGEGEGNESVVQNTQKRLKELTESDISASPEEASSTLQALISFKRELKGIVRHEETRLNKAMPLIRKHLRMDLKRLAEGMKPLYAIATEGEETMFARIMVKDQRILVYSLQKEKPSDDYVTVPFGFVKKLIPSIFSTVFFEIGTTETSFGKVYIRMPNPVDDYRHVKQTILMCTGERGVSYRNSSFFELDEYGSLHGGDYENNDGTGGKNVIRGYEGLYMAHPFRSYSRLRAFSGNDVSTRFFFHLEHHIKDVKQCYIGRVHHGLDVLKTVSRLEPVTKAVIRECGVVIPAILKSSDEEN